MSPSTRILVTLIAASVSFLLGTSAHAAPERELLRPALAPRGPALTGSEVLHQRFVDVDLEALREPQRELGVDGMALIELFPDIVVHLKLLRTEAVYAGGQVSSFRVEGDPGGEAIFSIVEDAVVARIRFGRRLFSIRPTPAGDLVVAQLDESIDDGCATEDGGTMTPLSMAPESAIAHPFQVDVMVPYTQEILTSLGSEAGVLALINACVFSMNEGLANSDVLLRVQLVHALLVGFTDDSSWTLGDMTDALDDPTDGTADELFEIREDYGADLVCLIFENLPSGGSVGKASYILCWDKILAGSADDTAFAVVKNSAALSNLSFGHELGHLLGAHHDVTTSGAASCSMTSAPYGCVTVPSGDYRDIMAYNASGHAVRLNMWSTIAKDAPNGESLGYAGAVAGIPFYVDNVDQLNLAAMFVPNYRTSVDIGYELTTTFDGVQSTRGCMFDVSPKNDLDLTGISLNIYASVAGSTVKADVWYFEHGSYAGHESDILGWKLLARGVGTAAGVGNETYLGLAPDALLESDHTYGIYVDLTTYVAGKQELRVTSGAKETFDNQDLHLATGVAKSAFFGSTTQTNRRFNGILHYRGATGERSLTTASPGTGAHDGLFFRVKPKRDIRLHCFDIVLQNAEPTMVDVWMAQQVPPFAGLTLDSYDWTYLGTDVLAEGAGPLLSARITVPHRDLQAGIEYVFYTHVAGNGAFGQKLLSGSSASVVANADLEVWDGAFLDGVAFTGVLTTGERLAATLHYSIPGPFLAFENFTSSAIGTIRVYEATPGDWGWLGISVVGPGPIYSIYGYLHLSTPYIVVPFTVGATGEWLAPVWIPPTAAGLQVWGHAFMTGTKEFTSAVAVEID